MSENKLNPNSEHPPNSYLAFRWRKLSFSLFRRIKSDKEKFKNFFGQSIDEEPHLPETGE